MKLITVLTPCFNEEQNVEPLYEAVKAELAKLPHYRYEHLFIDNASTDRTVTVLRSLAERETPALTTGASATATAPKTQDPGEPAGQRVGAGRKWWKFGG